MDLYAENILDHYKRPRNKRALKAATISGRAENPSCGDDLSLSLAMKGGRIVDVGWMGSGCAVSQAAMSLLSEELLGKSSADVAAIDREQILGLLGVPIGARRMDCALLCLQALRSALTKQPTQN